MNRGIAVDNRHFRRIGGQNDLHIGCGLVANVFEGHVEAHRLAIVGLTVGIVDNMAVVSEVSTVCRDDVDVSDLGDFVETRHNEFCRPHLSRAFKG